VLVAAVLALAGAGGLPRAAEPKGAPAQLQEEPIQLKDAPGRDLTASRCNVCHSLEYIPSNAPAMNRTAWQKTIQKMKERFGAPITDEEATQILDYLDGSYSGKS
jgi:sulfite dehydrogenase (cytochrome) subunit B